MRLCHQPLRRVYHLQGRRTPVGRDGNDRERFAEPYPTLDEAAKGLGAYPEGVSPCHTGRIRGVDRILRAAGDEGERKMGMARCLQRDDRPRRSSAGSTTSAMRWSYSASAGNTRNAKPAGRSISPNTRMSIIRKGILDSTAMSTGKDTRPKTGCARLPFDSQIPTGSG